VAISLDDDTNSTEESDCEYDSEHDSNVDMCMEDDVDAPYGVDLDGGGDRQGTVTMERMKMKRRKLRRRRRRMRKRMRMRMMAKNLGRLARERW